jgi:hypothetical protein
MPDDKGDSLTAGVKFSDMAPWQGIIAISGVIQLYRAKVSEPGPTRRLERIGQEPD